MRHTHALRARPRLAPLSQIADWQCRLVVADLHTLKPSNYRRPLAVENNIPALFFSRLLFDAYV